MIVVGAEFGDLVTGLAVGEMPLFRDSRVDEETQGSVDRREADIRLELAHPFGELLHGEVARGAEEDLEDQFSLAGVLETLTLDVVLETSPSDVLLRA